MNELVIDEEINIENMIYEIRGKQVMLDSDLAKLYQVETKRINEAVSRNKEKFPERFSWILNDEESRKLLVAIFDQKNNVDTRGGKYKNPRVFTEQGTAMLATILKSKIAIEISIGIMDAFVNMRKYISSELNNINIINSKLLEHDNRINLLEESFNKLSEKQKINTLFYDG